MRGSAILSATALACGWDALPVDKASCRFESHTPLILLDMRDPQTVEVLTHLDKQRPVNYWHFGLPCGAASRARERPMPGKQAGPRPLRDADNFLGFPWLRGAEAAQTQAANEVYSAAIELLFLAFSTSALVTIENPTTPEAGCGPSSRN